MAPHALSLGVGVVAQGTGQQALPAQKHPARGTGRALSARPAPATVALRVTRKALPSGLELTAETNKIKWKMT